MAGWCELFLGFYFGFFIFGLSSFILGHDEFRAFFSIFMGSRVQSCFFYRAIELERMVVPVPATLY